MSQSNDKSAVSKKLASRIECHERSNLKTHPFREDDIFAAFRNLIEEVTQEIQSLNNEYILKASEIELDDYYVDKVTIRPLILHTEQYCIENQTGTQIDVSFRRAGFPGERAVVQGTRLDIAIPYEGDPMLWRIRPSTFSSSGYPEIEIRDDSIILSIEFPDHSADPERLKSEIDKHIRSLANAVQNLNRDVENHNRSAPQTVKSAIQGKRQSAESATGAIVALGIPMKPRDKPLTFTVPTKRRESPAKRPKVPTEAYKLEPVLEETEYQHILEVMHSMSLVIERSPDAFASLDEEAIRTHFLLQLNGHYEGSATGETFNAFGKTDILIRVENKNVFIAECKFWRGQKGLNEAVDQLLSYLSWRDTKCALLVFNKTKDSAAVRQKMHEVMEERPEHRRTVSYDPNGAARYVFVKESDPGREIIITTQLYDMPVSEK
jgi:hypothetical protein